MVKPGTTNDSVPEESVTVAGSAGGESTVNESAPETPLTTILVTLLVL